MRADRRFRTLTRMYWHRQRGHVEVPYFPIRLWVEATNRCNLRCAVCPNATDTTSERGDMAFDLYTRLIEECRGRVHDINLSHRGESLYHPRLAEMVKLAGACGIRTRLHTNATMLDDDTATALIDAGLDLISFSFDGFDKENYEAIRCGAIYESTLANIFGFLKQRKERDSQTPYTILQVIASPNRSVGDREAFLAQFRDLPLDKLYVKEPHNWAGNVGEKAVETGSPPGPVRSSCTFNYYSLTVLWDGRVVPCPQDWYAECVLGDLNRSSLEAIWNGKEMRGIRTRMQSLNVSGLEPCDRCDRIRRRTLLGVPVENLKAFLGETLGGYRLARKLIKR